MTASKTRSRILILSHIAQFSLGREVGGRDYAGLGDMRFREDWRPSVGSLVALGACSPSKWYLSWVHNVVLHAGGDCTYTLESIEDGELCDWSNVAIWAYDRTQTDRHLQWRWTDAQHEFSDRWNSACFKDRDAYITLPCLPVFGEGNTVTLATRTRFGFNAARPEKTFPDWRKTTKKMMLEFYDECVAAKNVAPLAAALTSESQQAK